MLEEAVALLSQDEEILRVAKKHLQTVRCLASLNIPEILGGPNNSEHFSHQKTLDWQVIGPQMDKLAN